MRRIAPYWTGFARIGICVCSFGMGLGTAVADPTVVAAGSPPQTSPAIQFTVIESKAVWEGNHSVIYNRVAPPQLPIASPTSPNSTSPALSGQVPQSLLQLQAQQPKLENLFITATVYNHQISDVTWSINGATYRAYSNIDFSVLDGFTQFTSGDTVYGLLLLVTNQGANPNVPPAAAVPSIPRRDVYKRQGLYLPSSGKNARSPYAMQHGRN